VPDDQSASGNLERALLILRRLSPTRPGGERLLLAILDDAIACYLKYATATDPKRKKLFDRTVRWVERRDASWIFSFERICDEVKLDARRLRVLLNAWKDTARGET
jgi:hypothetical protein